MCEKNVYFLKFFCLVESTCDAATEMGIGLDEEGVWRGVEGELLVPIPPEFPGDIAGTLLRRSLQISDYRWETGGALFGLIYF